MAMVIIYVDRYTNIDKYLIQTGHSVGCKIHVSIKTYSYVQSTYSSVQISIQFLFIYCVLSGFDIASFNEATRGKTMQLWQTGYTNWMIWNFLPPRINWLIKTAECGRITWGVKQIGCNAFSTKRSFTLSLHEEVCRVQFFTASLFATYPFCCIFSRPHGESSKQNRNWRIWYEIYYLF